MSTIGSGGAGIPPFVGSVAGAAGQQRVAGANQAAGEAAQRTFEAQRQQQLQQTVGDVAESDETGERDADGREAWRWQQPGTTGGSPSEPRPHGVDPDEERGRKLDLDA